jgi:hypothetical protein
MAAAVQVAGVPVLWAGFAGWISDALDKPGSDAEECVFVVA